MKVFLAKLISGKDNVTPDIGRVMYGVSMIWFHFGQGWSLFHDHHPFDPKGYAETVGGLAAAFGVHLWMKSNTEPGGGNA